MGCKTDLVAIGKRGEIRLVIIGEPFHLSSVHTVFKPFNGGLIITVPYIGNEVERL